MQVNERGHYTTHLGIEPSAVPGRAFTEHTLNTNKQRTCMQRDTFFFVTQGLGGSRRDRQVLQHGHSVQATRAQPKHTSCVWGRPDTSSRNYLSCVLIQTTADWLRVLAHLNP